MNIKVCGKERKTYNNYKQVDERRQTTDHARNMTINFKAKKKTLEEGF
jgi:hypothetical protein